MTFIFFRLIITKNEETGFKHFPGTISYAQVVVDNQCVAFCRIFFPSYYLYTTETGERCLKRRY